MVKDILMTFIGTTISILLTFGTAHLQDRKKQKEAERTASLMVIHNIESCYYSLKSDIEELEQADSLNQVVLRLAPDSLGQLSDEDIRHFFWIFLGRHFTINDNTAESIFSTNIDTWKNIGSSAFIEIAGKCFSIKHLIEQLQQEIDGDIRAAYNAYHVSTLNADVDVSFEQQTAQALRIPEVYCFICKLHDFYIPSLKAALDALKEQNSNSKKLMNVSDEELRTFGDNQGEKRYEHKSK